MANFSSEEKYAFFLDVWEAAPDGAETFFSELVNRLRACVAMTRGGVPVGSTTQNGNSTSRDQLSRLSPLELQALYAEGVRRYADAKAIVGADEALIWDRMGNELLYPVTEERTDFSCYGYH